MGSAVDRKEIGEGGKEDKQEENNERFRRGISRHLLQFDTKEPVSSTTECSHPALPGKIPNNSMIYNRNECRLCQCIMGELICEPKPELCYQRYWLGKHLCHMEEGEALRDGERHFDGCNNCLCRNGELLCTRIRCPSADNNYTNYGEAIASKTLNNSTKSETNVRKRGKDPCMECDYEPILPVCGLNWITYRSMCHAIHCGGHNMEQVYQGPCKHKNPCDDAKCAEHEICLNRKQGPCLASTTTDGEVVECQQHQCVNPSQDCTSVSEGKVCGEDHQTYSSECAMSAQGVALAYNGSCEEECADDYSQMCGMDGVTLASSCAAAFLYSHIDYPGACDDVDPQTSVITSSRETYYNRRCKIVEEYLRCPPLECKSQVIPEGSCCPTCGKKCLVRVSLSRKNLTLLRGSRI
ncbi:reversion-inducing cysteine-rich protein with Kazal motifs-like [Montipora foliosa]|uniref:reversion-inducing cysteine-rich protein with Kazal motifs-like n=1 Tax=Montipora foliosa TaxID=591990 RepID=UPI0035F0FAF8